MAVTCVVADEIATITLDSPSNRNALSKQLVNELHLALDRAERDDVRAVVVTHTGNTFCAGADLKERLSGPVDSTLMASAFRRLMESNQISIAAVKGFVRAGGIGLMASCDLVVVPSTANFAFTEVRLGVAPALISVPILRRCAASRIAAPFLTGDVFDAATALGMGLVSHVADDVAGVEAQVQALCAALLLAGPHALAATKQILQTVPGEAMNTALPRMQRLSESLFESAEGAEGMRSFLDKRPPAWVSDR